MNNTFIAAGIDEYNTPYWIENTDPVVWSHDKSMAKRYLCLSDLQFDIKMNEDTLRTVFDTSSMHKVEAYEVDDNLIDISHCTILKKGVYNV